MKLEILHYNIPLISVLLFVSMMCSQHATKTYNIRVKQLMLYI